MAPAGAETVHLFAKFLARSFKVPQSIMNYVASVKLWHTLLDLDMTLFMSIKLKLTKEGLFRIMQHTVRQASQSTPEIRTLFWQKLSCQPFALDMFCLFQTYAYLFTPIHWQLER